LIDLCCTRWAERIDAFSRFKALHREVACFETIASEVAGSWTRDAITDANTHLLATSITDFIADLVIANHCLNYLLPLTRSLQSVAKDIVEAITEVEHLKKVLSDLCKHAHSHYSQWFTEKEEMCQAVGNTPSFHNLYSVKLLTEYKL
jgi:hypothetical protein